MIDQFSHLSDADTARAAGFAQFATKPDGGSMWADFLVGLDDATMARATGNALTPERRRVLTAARDAERARGYYWEDDLAAIMAAAPAGVAANVAATTATQQRYDAARADAIARAAALTPTVAAQSSDSPAARRIRAIRSGEGEGPPPVLVDRTSGVRTPVLIKGESAVILVATATLKSVLDHLPAPRPGMAQAGLINPLDRPATPGAPPPAPAAATSATLRDVPWWMWGILLLFLLGV